MATQWKDVVGFEGLYEVSNGGQVRRHMQCPDDSWRRRINTWPGRPLKQRKREDGYWIVGLHRDGKVWKRPVHIFVAAAFKGPCPNGMEVNHEDGNKENNCDSNLEYRTHKYNMRHAQELGLWNPACNCGEKQWKAKLTAAHVTEIRDAQNYRGRRKELAERFGVSQMTISRVRSGRSWRHLS